MSQIEKPQEPAAAPAQAPVAQPIQTSQPFASIMATGSMKDIEAAIEREIAVTDTVRKFCLRLTSLADWIDQDGKPYLQWTGTAKIAAKVGLEVVLDKDNNGNPIYRETFLKDEEGDWMEITITGTVRKDGLEIPEMGTASSRDSLFGVRYKDGQKYYLPLSEIDRTDIRKKAVTNLLNRAVKSRMGFSFTWEEIADATNGAITQDRVKAKKGGSVSYAKGSKGGTTEASETKSIRQEVWNMILEMSDGEENAAHKLLAEKSGFEGKDQQTGKPKWVNGKENIADFTEAWIKKLHPKIKADYEVFKKTFNNEGYGEDAPPAAGPHNRGKQ